MLLIISSSRNFVIPNFVIPAREPSEQGGTCFSNAVGKKSDFHPASPTD
jgi:hypothetical protein